MSDERTTDRERFEAWYYSITEDDAYPSESDLTFLAWQEAQKPWRAKVEALEKLVEALSEDDLR